MTTTALPAIPRYALLTLTKPALAKAAGQFKHSGKYVLINSRWKKLHPDQPAPSKAPTAAHLSGVGQYAPAKHFTDDEWAQLKLPADNVNAASHNKKVDELKQLSEAGNVAGILALQYGTNTYGKKAATIANHLLGLHGAPHKVTPGQKAGEHPALHQPGPRGPVEAPATSEPAPDPTPAESSAVAPAEPEPVQSQPAATSVPAPEFVEGKTKAGVKAYYEKVWKKIQDLAAAGDVAGLQALKEDGLKPNAKGKVGNTWSGKTKNSQLLLAGHAAVLEQLGAAPAQAEPAPKKPRVMVTAARPKPAPDAAPSTPPEPAPAPTTSKLDQIPWDAQLLPPENKNAKSHNKQVAKIKAMAEAGDIAGLEAFKAGTNTYGKKQMKLAALAAAALKESAPAAAAEPPAAPQAALGPKDGDTKPGADGMLVFKDGRWHKQQQEPATPEPAAAAPEPKPSGLDALQVPDFSGQGLPANHEKIFNTATAHLLAAAKAQGAEGLKGKIIQHKTGFKAGAYTLKGPGFKIKNVKGIDPNKPAWGTLHTFITDLLAATGKPKKAKKPAAAAASPAAAAPADLTAGIESMDDWKQTGEQAGSNPGGRFMDANGVEWYCKFPSDADTAKAELLAAKLYGLAGLSAQDAKLITKNGKIGIASRWVDIKKGSAEQLAALEGAQSGFAVDAWLANWDVVGLSYDNLQIGADGKAHRVDAGGSLMYRAQGEKKAFGPHVGEIDSMRDPNINPQAAAVFGSMSEADITASVAKVAAISDDDIYSLVMEHGPGSVEDRAELVDTLIARKEFLLSKYQKAAKKAEAKKEKPKPDPTKLQVDASQLPPVHDFKNWKGPGQGLSSVAWVNEANQKAEQDLLDFALKGNLVALKDYHFEAVDKESGQSLGMKPIEQHPSQHVKGYWSDLVAALNYIANPPEALKHFKSVVAATVKKVSDAFKSATYGTTVNHVEANSRLAFWIALGHTKPVEALVPDGGSLQFESSPTGTPPMTASMKSAAKAAYSNLAPNRLVKRFINGIQSSGSYNDNFRDGKMITSDGHDAVAMTLDAYEYATEKPAGFELYKWVSFPGHMGQQLLQTPPGTVFQNPGSMCCSYDPTATSGFGPDRIRIRYANGAKAVDSFGSGNYKSEQEITTLPGQRFVILSCKKVQCPVKGKQRIELDLLMLPPDPGYVAELKANIGKHGTVAA